MAQKKKKRTRKKGPGKDRWKERVVTLRPAIAAASAAKTASPSK